MTGLAQRLVLAGALASAVACGSQGGHSSSGVPYTGKPWVGLPSGPIGITGAARLLTQGTFGATIDGIDSTATQTYADGSPRRYRRP